MKVNMNPKEIFRHLFQNEWTKREIQLNRKEPLFSQGETPEFIYLIESGSIKLVQTIHGKDLIVRLATPGGLVGHRSLFEPHRYRAAAIAIAPTKLYQTPRELFLQTVTASQELSMAFMQILSADTKETERRLHLLHSGSVRQRVARVLVQLSNSHGQQLPSGAIRISLQLSRDDLAAMTSVAMENVVRTLSDFKSENILDQEGRLLVITDHQSLTNLSL